RSSRMPVSAHQKSASITRMFRIARAVSMRDRSVGVDDVAAPSRISGGGADRIAAGDAAGSDTASTGGADTADGWDVASASGASSGTFQRGTVIMATGSS